MHKIFNLDKLRKKKLLYGPAKEYLEQAAKDIQQIIDADVIRELKLFSIKEKIAKGEDLTEGELEIMVDEI